MKLNTIEKALIEHQINKDTVWCQYHLIQHNEKREATGTFVIQGYTVPTCIKCLNERVDLVECYEPIKQMEYINILKRLIENSDRMEDR